MKDPMFGKVGEVRNTGSIAYDLAMVATGVLQYSIAAGPYLWDVAGGAVLVIEAGQEDLHRLRLRGPQGQAPHCNRPHDVRRP